MTGGVPTFPSHPRNYAGLFSTVSAAVLGSVEPSGRVFCGVELQEMVSGMKMTSYEPYEEDSLAPPIHQSVLRFFLSQRL